jgi:hypothetical protein
MLRRHLAVWGEDGGRVNEKRQRGQRRVELCPPEQRQDFLLVEQQVDGLILPLLVLNALDGGRSNSGVG